MQARLLLSMNQDSPLTLETIRSAYHKKLFEIHPDTAQVVSEESGARIAEIIEARNLLEEFVKLGSPTASPVPANVSVPLESGKDGYNWYRRASDAYGECLDDYWRERLRFSHIPEKSPEVRRFYERLEAARQIFARVLEEFPGGMWTPDAVEKIAKINVWLKK